MSTQNPNPADYHDAYAGIEDGGTFGDLPNFIPPGAEPRRPSIPEVVVEEPSVATSNIIDRINADHAANQAAHLAGGDVPEVQAVEGEGVSIPLPSDTAADTAVHDAAPAPAVVEPANEVVDVEIIETDVVEPIVGEAKDDRVVLEDQLRMIAERILAERGVDPANPESRLTEAELQRVAQHLNIGGAPRQEMAPDALVAAPGAMGGSVDVTRGQQIQMKGGAAVAEGLGALVGGALNLVGAAGKVAGQAANHVADFVKGRDSEAKADAPQNGLPAVLPRLSEYRIAQVEKAAASFGQEADGFWNSSTKLTALHSEMERVARERGLSMQDVVEKMKPGGELADLREKFNEAVGENPETGTRRKAMDKALDSYVRQYGRAQEELLNPEQQGNPHYDKLKDRLRNSHDDMENKASGVPAFLSDKGELEPSHFERLKEAIAKIMEKLKEVAKDFVAMIRGTSGSNDNAPAP